MHHFARSTNEDNIERCFDINNSFRDVRLSTDGKVKELQNFINLIQEYNVKHRKSDLSELKLPVTVEKIQNFLNEYTQYNPKLKYAFIRGMHGRFLSSQNGTRSMTAIDRPVPLGWEVFAIEETKKGKVAIKSCGKYVSSKNGDRDFRCNSVNIGASKLFDITEHGNGIYSFKGSNGKYISSPAEEEAITCYSADISNDEKFHIEWIVDLVDEINISWYYYNEYFKRLCEECNIAIEEKKTINPEKYFINDEIEVYHDSAEKSYHKQQLFNQKDFKDAMLKIDKKFHNAKWKISNEMNYLSSLFWGEKSNNEKIIGMLKTLQPAFEHFGMKSL